MDRMKYYKAEKLVVFQFYKNRYHSIVDITAKFSVISWMIKDWKRRYEINGEDGLTDSDSWNSYSKELKLVVVNTYLSGKYSLSKVIPKYNISSTAIFRKWIKNSNSHRELNDTGKGMKNSMTNRIKIALEERIKIVNYCIPH